MADSKYQPSEHIKALRKYHHTNAETGEPTKTYPTFRQRDFVRLWLSGQYSSPKQAAIALGIPEHAASKWARRVLISPKVQAYMRREYGALGITPEEVRAFLSQVIRANMGDYLKEVTDDEGHRWTEINSEALQNPDLGRIVKRVKVSPRTGHVISLELHDPLKAAALVVGPSTQANEDVLRQELIEMAKQLGMNEVTMQMMAAVLREQPAQVTAGQVIEGEVKSDHA